MLPRSAKIAVRAEILETGKEIYSYNAKVPMIPASNLKLLISGCALFNFGPGYRFKTVVLGEKVGSNGELPGDLVLRGSGDPTWNVDFYPKPLLPLTKLAEQLKQAGVQKVSGDLVVDDTFFDREFTGKGWKSRYQWEDYATEVAALSLNKNIVNLTVLPGPRIGAPAQFSMNPPNHLLTIVNHAWTSQSRSDIRTQRDRTKNSVVVSGPISINSQGVGVSFNIHNPPMLVASAFYQILKSEGIQIQGKARAVRPYEISLVSKLTQLAEVESPPLLAIIRRLDKESDNFLAEHLFRNLGAKKYGKGSIHNSALAVSNCLNNLGLTGTPVTLADGSGLSEQDRVSALTLVRLLKAVSSLPIGADFRNSLPQGGVDGTLEDRLKDIPVQAKTGAIRGVSSLSGYVINRSGQTVVFSILINQFPGSSERARRIIDSMVRIFADTGDTSHFPLKNRDVSLFSGR